MHSEQHQSIPISSAFLPAFPKTTQSQNHPVFLHSQCFPELPNKRPKPSCMLEAKGSLRRQTYAQCRSNMPNSPAHIRNHKPARSRKLSSNKGSITRVWRAASFSTKKLAKKRGIPRYIQEDSKQLNGEFSGQGLLLPDMVPEN